MEKVKKLIEIAETLHEEATPVGTLVPDHILEYAVSSESLAHLGGILSYLRNSDVAGNNGQSTFENIGRETGRLVAKKNREYGDSFAKSGEVLRIFYPDGIRPDQYDDLLAMLRIIDKQFRVATDKDAFGESPWVDITGYGILAQNFNKKKGESKEEIDAAFPDVSSVVKVAV